MAAFFFFFLVPQGRAYVWLAPVITAIQNLVAGHMRATASARFLLANNLIGLGGGSFALGAPSDGLSADYGDETLRYAMLTELVLYIGPHCSCGWRRRHSVRTGSINRLGPQYR